MSSASKPNFLILGVQKAGTTFLAKVLSDHPDVFFSKPKELFFFNARHILPQQFEDYLATNFQQAESQAWIGEGSTTYFQHQQAIKHIGQYLGHDLRMMVCLRHPVERCLSHYLHDYRRGRCDGRETVSSPGFASYIARSYYAGRLAAWKKQFPHLKVLYFDDLVASGADYYGQAADFLGITPQPIQDVPVNEGMRLVWEGDDLALAAPPPEGQAVPRFARQDLEALTRAFATDIAATEKLTGRDLTPWRQLPDFGQIGDKFGHGRAPRRRKRRKMGVAGVGA